MGIKGPVFTQIFISYQNKQGCGEGIEANYHAVKCVYMIRLYYI